MTRIAVITILVAGIGWADESPKPYSPPCVVRENDFAFTEKPVMTKVGENKYAIAFAVRGNCDVTVGIMRGTISAKDGAASGGTWLRHLASGVLGEHCPPPFARGSTAQRIVWDGNDDNGQPVSVIAPSGGSAGVYARARRDSTRLDEYQMPSSN